MEEILVILSSTWKFAATFPVAVYIFKMSFFETVLYTNIGGLAGLIVFAFASKGIIHLWNVYWPKKWNFRHRNPKVFTKRNRRIITLKNKYGLAGIVILTPVLLSIPLGVFINAKYFDRNKMSYVYLFIGQLVWSIVYTFVYTQIKQVSI